MKLKAKHSLMHVYSGTEKYGLPNFYVVELLAE
jgi:hypothetical protein